MKSSIPLFAIGAIVVVAALSQKKPASTSTGTKGTGGLKIPGTKIDPNKPGGKIKVIGGIKGQNPIGCDLMTEYYDPDTKQCVKFWKPGETDVSVENKIAALVAAVEGLQTSDICEDSDPQTPNPYALNIIKQTIVDLWGIPKDMLPPTANSESWIFTVWNKVVDIYYSKVCAA